MKKIYLSKKQLPDPNKTTIIVQKDHEYCIINQAGEYFAIDNICPHKFASLGLGDILNDEIKCPLHEFRFNFKTGKCHIENYKVNTYNIIVKD